MTVSANVRKAGPYTGNGSATSFAFNFKATAEADLRVVLTVISTEAESDLVLDSDYSVALNPDQEADPGGTITYPLTGDPMASTHKLTVVSNLAITQTTDITNGGGFYPQVLEDAFDRQTMLIGQLQEQIDRAVLVDVSSDTDPADLLDELAADVAAAAASAAAAAASLDSFDDRYLGAKASDPTVDNDGAALITGAIYFNTTAGEMRTWNGTQWAGVASVAYVPATFTGDGATTAFTLPVAPISKNNLFVHFDAAYQFKAGYSVSGTTLTFTSAPPDGVSIEALIAQPLPVASADADNVTYTPSGTGAVQRTAQDKLRERVSVKDFSPTDTDWQPAFVAALDAASVVEVPYLADGYEIASGFTIPTGKKLVGTCGIEQSAFGSAAVGDRGTVIIKAKQAGFTGSAAITMGTRTALEGVTVYGTATAAAIKLGNNTQLRSVRAVRGNYGLDVSNVGGISLIDVHADACNYGMYSSSGGTDIQALNCVFSNSVYDGAMLNSGAGQIAFTNTRFEWNGGAPIKLFDVVGGVTFDGSCVADRNGEPIRFQGTTSNVVIGAGMRLSRNGATTADPALKVHFSFEGNGSNFKLCPAHYIATSITDDGLGAVLPEYCFSVTGTYSSIDLYDQPASQNTGVYYDAATQTAMARNFTIQQQESTLTAAATGTTVIPQDDTIPQNTEGDQYLTVAITPRRAGNWLLVEAEAVVSHSVAAHIVGALFRDAGADALAVTPQYQATATGIVSLRVSHRVQAGSTTATTFALRIGATSAGTTTVNGSGTFRYFGGTGKTVLRVTELAA